jgi:hypothetical protein
MPWIDYHFVDTMPTLAVDKTSSAYDSLISDYRYRETTITLCLAALPDEQLCARLGAALRSYALCRRYP